MRALLVAIESLGDTLPFIGLGRALRERATKSRSSGAPCTARWPNASNLISWRSFPPRSISGEFSSVTDGTVWRRSTKDVAICSRPCRKPTRRLPTVTSPARPSSWLKGLMFGARIAQEKLGVPLATVHLQPAFFRNRDPGPRLAAELASGIAQTGLSDHGLCDRLASGGVDQCFSRQAGAGAGQSRPRSVVEFAAIDNRLFSRVFGPAEQGNVSSDDLPGISALSRSSRFRARGRIGRVSCRPASPPMVFSPTSLLTASQDFLQCSVKSRSNWDVGQFCSRQRSSTCRRGCPTRSGILISCLTAGCSRTRRPSSTMVVSVPWLRPLPPVYRNLSCPRVLDQPDNARRLRELGVAEVVKPKDYRKPARLRPRSQRLIASPAVADRCRQLSALCRADQALETVVEALEKLCGSVGCQRVCAGCRVTCIDPRQASPGFVMNIPRYDGSI